MTQVLDVRFDSFGECPNVTATTTYEQFRAGVLKVGRFSCFEATATARTANFYTALCKDPEVETINLGYPWTGVKKRSAKMDPTKTDRDMPDQPVTQADLDMIDEAVRVAEEKVVSAIRERDEAEKRLDEAYAAASRVNGERTELRIRFVSDWLRPLMGM